jgi:hypothetical protein
MIFISFSSKTPTGPRPRKKTKHMTLVINSSSPESLRLTYRFWIELGRPAGFRNCKTLESWSKQIEVLVRASGLDYESFRWFVIWALRRDDPDGARYGNDHTARNLRMARDPMGSFAKQFEMTYAIFTRKADKAIPLLRRKREQEEAEARMIAAAALEPTWMDILPPGSESWEVEKARFFDVMDAEFPLRGPMEGESVEDWVMRECAPLHNPDWRCPFCTFGISLDGEDAPRTRWCFDCAEERKMYSDEDREWMRFETPSVSCLTREWD